MTNSEKVVDGRSGQGGRLRQAPLVIHFGESQYIVASELKDPICHSDECQIGSFSSEATI